MEAKQNNQNEADKEKLNRQIKSLLGYSENKTGKTPTSTDQPKAEATQNRPPVKKRYWDKRGNLITHPALIAVAEKRETEAILRWSEKNPELSKEIEDFEKEMESKYAAKYKNTGSYGK